MRHLECDPAPRSDRPKGNSNGPVNIASTLPRPSTGSPRGRPTPSASSAAAGRWSPSPAASTPASSRVSAPGPSAPSTSSACGCPSGTRPASPPTSAWSSPRARGADGRGADHRGARGARLLPPARRGDPPRCSPTTSRVAAQARPLARRPADRSSSRSSSSARTGPRSSADATRRLPGADRRDQHETADPQAVEYTWADRLVRGRRDPEPARVRPGVLRQGRRRAGRREADRRPLQEPGLRAGPRARPARGDRRRASRPRRRSASRRPRRSSTSATRYDPMDLLCGATTTASRRRARRAGRARRRRGRGRLPRDRAAACGDALPARAGGARRAAAG